MTQRRSVRVDLRFLEQLDVQLGEERGPNGEPSRIDFLRFELPAIEDDFALRFEELPEVIPVVPGKWRVGAEQGRCRHPCCSRSRLLPLHDCPGSAQLGLPPKCRAGSPIYAGVHDQRAP